MSKVDPKVILVNLSSFFRFFDEDETRGKIFGRKIRGVAQSPLEKRVRATIMDKRGVIRISRPRSREPVRIFIMHLHHCSWESVDRPRIMQMTVQETKMTKGPFFFSRLPPWKRWMKRETKKRKKRLQTSKWETFAGIVKEKLGLLLWNR